MQLGMSTKINLLLVSTVFALSLYLYFILKDVGRFEKNIIKSLEDLREEIENMKKTPSVVSPAAILTASTSGAFPVPVGMATVVSTGKQPLAPAEDLEEEGELDEEVSIMSNEIKSILTSIPQDEDEDEDEGKEEVQEVEPKTPHKDMDREELAQFTNGELKTLLKDMGLGTYGAKDALIERIKSHAK